MRKQCLSCVEKHLAAAAVAETEYHLGYPEFRLWIIGNLDHAATEAFRAHPRLAELIRAHRLKWSESPEAHDIPYEELGVFVAALMRIVDTAPVAAIDIPSECKDGLGDDELARTDTR